MCEFQSLYYSDDGYVAQCKDCGYYQVAFGNTMLSLSTKDYITLRKVVKKKCNDIDYASFENTRNIVIPTPSAGLFILLTKEEVNSFHRILEAADTEEKAQQLMALFHL
ncbi:hypothetical protein F0919_18290 [Taibaiella lutea]|uniref:Uncharacterized protein n=1 Tax=Taibaiella lutea TaxID=2608001 RepID=A0A5M6CE49_9BACT|nr:DUF6686 family protein [Taibaiella lutea]KAA5532730.1 hypothetical protein F0919_18290 [Taibaiella lutea]